MTPPGTLVELLRHRARTTPDRPAYTLLVGGEEPVDWTWAELDARARAVGAWLQTHGARGERVLLLYPEGLEYLAAFFGCLYAGALAVPAHPPAPRRLDRTLPRIHAVASSASVRFVFTTAPLCAARDAIGTDNAALTAATWIDTAAVPTDAAAAWRDPGLAPTDLAYLQYTSGSTADPKGVMVSHGNLTHQLFDFDTGYGHTPDSVLVTWLPATHDLGLVYGRLMGLFTGSRTVFFDAGAFMQRPARWLEAITRFRGTHTAAPDFGYALTAGKVTPAELAGLELSSLRVALNGAEPIRVSSEEAFRERFGGAGLSPSALTHAMGMSEATAKILTEPIDRAPARFLWLDPRAYEAGQVVEVPRGTAGALAVASNGSTLHDTVVVIADPDTHDALPEDRVGEMWVGGTTVAQGYWQLPDATDTTFRAHLSDGRGPFLRTGDLAFVHGGEVYLSGRLKDVIIVRGQNHHPQDLEYRLGQSHAALRPNCAAGFAIDDGHERLGIVAEVYPDRVDDPAAVFAAIRASVADHGLAPDHIVLIGPRELPKTSSGKIRRGEARRRFLAGELAVLHRWDRLQSAPMPQASQLAQHVAAATPATARRLLEDHAAGLAAALLGVDPDDIDRDQPFRELGLDSVTAVEMVEALGKTLGRRISGTALFDHPTIAALARWLVPDEAPTQPVTAAAHRTGTLSEADVAAMSEEEATARLLAELEDL